MEETIIVVFALIAACGLLPFFLLPAYFSFKEKHPSRRWILGANILVVIVPLLGLIANSYTVGVVGMLAGYIACLRWSLTYNQARR